MCRGLVVVVFVVGCFSRAQFDQAHDQRVTAINDRYDEIEQTERARWDALARDINDQRKYLAPIAAGSGYAPTTRVSDDESFQTLQRSCVDISNQAKNASLDAVPQLNQLATECVQKLIFEIYLPLLRQRYWKADDTWATNVWKESNFTADIESLFAFSHNRMLLAEIDAEAEQVRSSREKAIADIEHMRLMEIEQSAEQRDEDVARAEQQHRARLAAVGAALSAMGQSMSQASVNRTTSYSMSPSTVSSSSNTCTSDFTCGIGYTCVKALYSSSGYCAKAVNEYGNQTFNAPNVDSVGPNLRVNTSCMRLGCPIGFSCDMNSGACLR